MNKIDKLLEELCPEGVEYRTLGEVAIIRKGRDYKHLGKGETLVYGRGKTA